MPKRTTWQERQNKADRLVAERLDKFISKLDFMLNSICVHLDKDDLLRMDAMKDDLVRIRVKYVHGDY
jgi:hypothetical protein